MNKKQEQEDESLYKTDEVNKLTAEDFYFDEKVQNPKVQIKKHKFVSPGVLKVYANWCPHCRDKVECMIELANGLKAIGSNISIYVMDCPDSNAFSKAIGLESYPTFYACDEKGYLSPLKLNGVPVRDVPDILAALSEEHPDLIQHAEFNQPCFKK